MTLFRIYLKNLGKVIAAVFVCACLWACVHVHSKCTAASKISNPTMDISVQCILDVLSFLQIRVSSSVFDSFYARISEKVQRYQNSTFTDKNIVFHEMETYGHCWVKKQTSCFNTLKRETSIVLHRAHLSLGFKAA